MPKKPVKKARKKAPKRASKTHSSTSSLSSYKLVPNVITLFGLVAGMTAIQYAIDGKWEFAVIAIVVAAFIDALDGATARLLKASSALGAELDTLSDFLCFGVAPATIMYLWALKDAGKIGWIVALVFAIATALRLARFNAESKEQKKPRSVALQKEKYFTGVPAPTGAGLALIPLIWALYCMENGILTTALPDDVTHYIAIWMLGIAILMVSRVPTFSTKQLHLHPKMVVPTLAAFGLLIAGLIHATWITLLIMGAIYGGMIPIGFLHAQKSRRKKT